MSLFTKLANDVFSPVDAGGTQRSVENIDAQRWGSEIERILQAFQAGGGIIFRSRSAMDEMLEYPPNQMAWVLGDSVTENNGIYRKISIPGSGSWTRLGDLPFSFIRATTTGGSPNAIAAASNLPIPEGDGGALISLSILNDNTGSPVTVSFGGGSPLTIKSNSGNDIAPGGLKASMVVAGYKVGSTFRLLSDQAGAAILAAAEDAANRAAAYAAMLSIDKIKFKTVVDLLADTIMSYTSGLGLVQVGAGDVVDAQGFRYEVAASDATDFSIETAGGVRVIHRNDYVTPEMFGMSSGASTAQHARMFKAMKAAIEDDIPLVIRGEYVLDVVDLSSLTAGGKLRMLLAGKLIHVDAASDDMIHFGDLDFLHIYGGGEIDGQQADQTSWINLLELWNSDRVIVEDLTIRNIKHTGLRKSNSNNTSTTIRRVNFIDGALHSGTMGEFCEFASIRGGKYTLVEGCRFVQTADPLANQARNPCGLDYINTGGSVSQGLVEVKGNYFENLGMHAAGNLLSPLDFYSYADVIQIYGNKFRKSRISPIRTSSGGIVDIARNDILQNVPQIVDGGSAYAEAAMIQPGLVDRGYVTDKNDVTVVTVRQNKGVIDNVTCRAVSASAGGTGLSNIYRNLHVAENSFRSSGTNGANAAIFANTVRFVTSEKNEIEGFAGAVRVQQTDNVAPLSSEANAKLAVRGDIYKNCPVGVYARFNITNMDVELDGVVMEGASTFAYTIRGARHVRITGGNLGAKPSDTANNASLTLRDVNGATLPAGLTTNTAWAVENCAGLLDRYEWGYDAVSTIATDAAATLAPDTTGRIVLHTGTLTADRTLTLSTTGAKHGKTRFRIVRTGGGAFNLSVGGLKNLATGQWCEVEYTGSAYVLAAFGSL